MHTRFTEAEPNTFRKIDLHMHTVFCDGINTPEEMVVEAVSRGMEAVGVCVHAHTPFDERYCASLENVGKFLAEMRRLKDAYRGRIRVFAGIEHDQYADTDLRDFDYVIASKHYLKLSGAYYPIDDSEEDFQRILDLLDGDYIRLSELYYEGLAESILSSGADIVGHLDLITKFNENGKLFDENDPRYLKPAFALIDRLIPAGIVFEINTGAISRGYRTSPYPSKSLRTYIREHGGTLILSSDAHRKEDLMYGFEVLSALADRDGYRFLDGR